MFCALDAAYLFVPRVMNVLAEDADRDTNHCYFSDRPRSYPSLSKGTRRYSNLMNTLAMCSQAFITPGSCSTAVALLHYANAGSDYSTTSGRSRCTLTKEEV